MFSLDQVPDWLKNSEGQSWLRVINDWGYYHHSELIVGYFLLTLFIVGLYVVYRVGKIRPALGANHWSDDALFEKKFGDIALDLAEVGLPLAHFKLEEVVQEGSQTQWQKVEGVVGIQSKIGSLPQSMTDLSIDQCLLIAQFCAWRGDSQAVRDAIRRVMVEGSAEEQKCALTLLEHSNQVTS